MNQDNPTPSPDNRAEQKAETVKKLILQLMACLDGNRGLSTTEITKFVNLVAAQTQQARLEGAIEQIMQDFLSLNVQFDGCVDEKDLIEWRESQLAALKGEK